MIIISRENVSPLEVMQIKQILRESYCPNESLANTFERFAGFVDGKIFFDDAQDIWAEIAAQFQNETFAKVIDKINVVPQVILTVI